MSLVLFLILIITKLKINNTLNSANTKNTPKNKAILFLIKLSTKTIFEKHLLLIIISLSIKSENKEAFFSKASSSKFVKYKVINAPSWNLDETIFLNVSFSPATIEDASVNFVYAGVVKNGNKITFAIFGTITRTSASQLQLARFYVPEAILAKLFPYQVGQSSILSQKELSCFVTSGVNNLGVEITCEFTKSSTTVIINLRKVDELVANTEYSFRIEQTFLLSENLVPVGE